MPDHVVSGTGVAAGTYECATCGFELVYDGTERLQPCPACAHGDWVRAADEAWRTEQ
jgi:hypothetical protein